jgi:hypothetical protein
MNIALKKIVIIPISEKAKTDTKINLKKIEIFAQTSPMPPSFLIPPPNILF